MKGMKVDIQMVKVRIETEIPDVYSTAEAASLLGIHYATLYRWIRAGKIIPTRIGDRTLIPKSEVERLSAACETIGRQP